MSDLYNIEISQLMLKHPFAIERKTAFTYVKATIVKVSLFVYQDRVNIVINNGHGFIESVDSAPFHPEDQRRVDWLISTARSMM